MIHATAPRHDEAVPSELAELLAHVHALPQSLRDALMPAVEDAIEQARFRSRALVIATEAISRLRMDLEMNRFDLDLTRIEKAQAMKS